MAKSEYGPAGDPDNFRADLLAPITPDSQAAERAYALLANTKLPPVISGDELEF